MADDTKTQTIPTDEQAYAFRYTNSGVTTAEGVIATIQAGVTYRISFDVVKDRSGVSYRCKLLSFAPGAQHSDVRNDMTFANTAMPGANVIISETNDGAGAGVDLVQVKIRRSLAPDAALFVRLKVLVTP